MNVTLERDLCERFEVAYNQIDGVLKKIVHSSVRGFTALVRVRARHHHLISAFLNELEQYTRLWNAIVHEKKELGNYITSPYLEVVEMKLLKDTMTF